MVHHGDRLCFWMDACLKYLSVEIPVMTAERRLLITKKVKGTCTWSKQTSSSVKGPTISDTSLLTTDRSLSDCFVSVSSLFTIPVNNRFGTALQSKNALFLWPWTETFTRFSRFRALLMVTATFFLVFWLLTTLRRFFWAMFASPLSTNPLVEQDVSIRMNVERHT